MFKLEVEYLKKKALLQEEQVAIYLQKCRDCSYNLRRQSSDKSCHAPYKTQRAPGVFNAHTLNPKLQILSSTATLEIERQALSISLQRQRAREPRTNISVGTLSYR